VKPLKRREAAHHLQLKPGALSRAPESPMPRPKFWPDRRSQTLWQATHQRTSPIASSETRGDFSDPQQGQRSEAIANTFYGFFDDIIAPDTEGRNGSEVVIRR